MFPMDVGDVPNRPCQNAMEQAIPGHLIGLQGRLTRPFLGVMGIWAALCGAFASNDLHWDSPALLTLALVLLLADLGWGNLWDLAVSTDWRCLLLAYRTPGSLAPVATLPYTQPHSPAERMFRRLHHAASWWREALWPSAGPAVLGFAAAAVLAAVLTFLLPMRIRPLNAGLGVLIVAGLIQRWHGQVPLAAQAFVQVGLSWLVGHGAFAEMNAASGISALAFSIATWGGLRVIQKKPGGLWLLDGAQVVVVTLLAALKQPLSAGAMGLLAFGQIALQPFLRQGDPIRVMRRMWPWLMVGMVVTALALP